MTTEYVVTERRANCRRGVGSFDALDDALIAAASLNDGEVEIYEKGQVVDRRSHAQAVEARRNQPRPERRAR